MTEKTQENILYLASLCDLFGMVSLRDPFKGLWVTSNDRGCSLVTAWITWYLNTKARAGGIWFAFFWVAKSLGLRRAPLPGDACQSTPYDTSSCTDLCKPSLATRTGSRLNIPVDASCLHIFIHPFKLSNALKQNMRAKTSEQKSIQDNLSRRFHTYFFTRGSDTCWWKLNRLK